MVSAGLLGDRSINTRATPTTMCAKKGHHSPIRTHTTSSAMMKADRPSASAGSKEAFKRIFTFPLLRHSEMPEELRREAMKLITGACQSHPNNNQSAAQQIKETLDAKYGGSWHAVVGEQFGFEVSHEPESLLYMFFGGNLAICVWKCS